MEAKPSDPPPPPPASDEYHPRWVLLDRYRLSKDDPPDANTTAASRTSTGQPIRVSLRLAAPPTPSQLCFDCPGLPRGTKIHPEVFAAAGDSVLVRVCSADLFVYSAGDAAAADPSRRLPSLSLLPTYHNGRRHRHDYMDRKAAAILRRGDGEVVVAELKIVGGEQAPEGELSVVRSGEWQTRRTPILHGEGKGEEISHWETDNVVAVGDHLLCWVDLYRGIIIVSGVVSEEKTPELRYVSLPVKPYPRTRDEYRTYWSSRSVSATDGGGGGVVKFVEVLPRCCCGDKVYASCARSREAFTVTTWTLRMDDTAVWEKNGFLDCDELWALDVYDGLPRVRPDWSLVDMDDPMVIVFQVSESHRVYTEEKETVWLFGVDMRRKRLRSKTWHKKFVPYSGFYIPCRVSKYFNLRSSEIIRHEENDMKLDVLPGKIVNKSSQTSIPKVMDFPEEIMAALRDIPGLAHDEMLRVYCILVRDVRGFKFRSVLALPVDMRRDYCLLLTDCNK